MSLRIAGRRILSLFRPALRWWIGVPAVCVAIFVCAVCFFQKPAPAVTIPSAFIGRPAGTRVFFSTDGRLLATLHESDRNNSPLCTTLRLHDVPSGKESATLHEDIGQLQSLAFSPDGTEVAVLWFNRLIQVWDTSSGEELRRYQRKEWQNWYTHLAGRLLPGEPIACLWAGHFRRQTLGRCFGAHGPCPGRTQSRPLVGNHERRRVLRVGQQS